MVTYANAHLHESSHWPFAMNITYNEKLKEEIIGISFWNNLLSHEYEVNMPMCTSMTTPLWGFSVPQWNKQLKQAQQVNHVIDIIIKFKVPPMHLNLAS